MSSLAMNSTDSIFVLRSMLRMVDRAKRTSVDLKGVFHMHSDLPPTAVGFCRLLGTVVRAISEKRYQATAKILFLIACASAVGIANGQSTTGNSPRQVPSPDVIEGIRETIQAIEPLEDKNRLSRLVSRRNATELADADLYALLL